MIESMKGVEGMERDRKVCRGKRKGLFKEGRMKEETKEIRNLISE